MKVTMMRKDDHECYTTHDNIFAVSAMGKIIRLVSNLSIPHVDYDSEEYFISYARENRVEK
jgi:hypothetical protein